MSVAFLVLATRNHGIFSALVSWFAGTECRFFVHVDAKFPMEPFDAIARASREVHVQTNRLQIAWGGFAMILAEVALAEAARKRGPYDKYVLLSDDSLPLRSPVSIITSLSGAEEMISAREATEERILARYARFYMNDFPAMSPRHCSLAERGVSPDQVPVLLDFAGAVLRGKKPLARLYLGSQWWALSDEALRYFISVFNEDEHLRASFRHSAVPDELYIQTVLRESRFAERIGESPMYTDFSRDPKPYILRTIADLERPLGSPKLFARKFSAEYQPLVEHIRADPRSRH